MFTIDPKITEDELKNKNLFKALFSMNKHQVATPETSLEEASTYVLFFREGKKRLSAFIGLCFLSTRRKLFYAHSANPFPEDDMHTIEDESRNFAEDLGAMLDERDFSNQPEEEKKRWIDGQVIFGFVEDAEAVPAAAENGALDTSVPEPSAMPDLSLPVEESPAPVAPVDAPAQPAPEPPPLEAQPEPKPVQEKNTVEEVLADLSEELAAAPAEQPIREKTVTAQPISSSAGKRQESPSKPTKSSSVKPPKEASRPEPVTTNDVVSRDREALARLLTSF